MFYEDLFTLLLIMTLTIIMLVTVDVTQGTLTVEQIVAYTWTENKIS